MEFCRINRRTLDRSLDPRPFAEDLTALADSGETHAKIRAVVYVAADLKVTPDGDFMTGLIGFEEEESLRSYDLETRSWLKGEVHEIVGATSQTVVPFAIDLRQHRRWVAYAPSQRIKSANFRKALAATLNHAVGVLGLLPSEWEVDPVLSTATVEEWVDEHAEITKMIRRIKLTNVLKDVDDARRKMRLLGANHTEETYTAPRAQALDLRDNDEFEDMIGGVETGDVELILFARAGRKSKAVFKSSDYTDRTTVAEWGGDLERAIELVLDALRDFSDRKGDVILDDLDQTAGSDQGASTVGDVSGPGEDAPHEEGSGDGDREA